jgi:hypothetical protein
MVQLLLLDHQSAGWPICFARTLEDFVSVGNMQDLDILILLLS